MGSNIIFKYWSHGTNNPIQLFYFTKYIILCDIGKPQNGIYFQVSSTLIMLTVRHCSDTLLPNIAVVWHTWFLTIFVDVNQWHLELLFYTISQMSPDTAGVNNYISDTTSEITYWGWTIAVSDMNNGIMSVAPLVYQSHDSWHH